MTESTKTTLTREALLAKATPRFEWVEVEGFGTVGLREPSELVRSRRSAQLFDADGNLVQSHNERRRVYSIIDQVMIDETTPMFSEADLTELLALASFKLDPLYVAIQVFNAEIDPGKKDESGESSES